MAKIDDFRLEFSLETCNVEKTCEKSNKFWSFCPFRKKRGENTWKCVKKFREKGLTNGISRDIIFGQWSRALRSHPAATARSGWYFPVFLGASLACGVFGFARFFISPIYIGNWRCLLLAQQKICWSTRTFAKRKFVWSVKTVKLLQSKTIPCKVYFAWLSTRNTLK